MQDQINEALALLDPANDEHWTADGAPRVDVVQELTGLEKLVRKDITTAAPNFTRATAAAPEPEPSEGDDEQEPDAAEQDEGPDSPELAELKAQAEELVPEEPSDEVRAQAREEFAALEAKFKALAKDREDIAKELEQAQKEMDEAYDRMLKVDPDMTNGEAIQEFIKRQNQNRLDRALRTQKILQGIDRKTLDPRAPIDAAMARNNSRGSTRPTRGPAR